MAHSRFGRSVLGLLILLLLFAGISNTRVAGAAGAGAQDAALFAQAQGTEEGELSPRYKPVPPEPKSNYDDSYLFAMTRGVADSTIHPAGKVPLFLLTVPLDLVFLPFATIAGFFG